MRLITSALTVPGICDWEEAVWTGTTAATPRQTAMIGSMR
jgi:hypothetical protein